MSLKVQERLHYHHSKIKMANYAVVDENNKVINVVVISDFQCEDENGNEVHEKVCCMKDQICGCDSTHKLIKTSYNGNIRGKYAGVGDEWNEELQKFISPSPRPYFVYNSETNSWDHPIPKPERTQFQIDNQLDYFWSEHLYYRDSFPWRLDYGGDYPENPEGRLGYYSWDSENYVEGDLESGFLFNDAGPEVNEEESDSVE